MEKHEKTLAEVYLEALQYSLSVMEAAGALYKSIWHLYMSQGACYGSSPEGVQRWLSELKTAENLDGKQLAAVAEAFQEFTKRLSAMSFRVS